jgi:hypothetical protein
MEILILNNCLVDLQLWKQNKNGFLFIEKKRYGCPRGSSVLPVFSLARDISPKVACFSLIFRCENIKVFYCLSNHRLFFSSALLSL